MEKETLLVAEGHAKTGDAKDKSIGEPLPPPDLSEEQKTQWTQAIAAANQALKLQLDELAKGFRPQAMEEELSAKERDEETGDGRPKLRKTEDGGAIPGTSSSRQLESATQDDADATDAVLQEMLSAARSERDEKARAKGGFQPY